MAVPALIREFVQFAKNRYVAGPLLAPLIADLGLDDARLVVEQALGWIHRLALGGRIPYSPFPFPLAARFRDNFGRYEALHAVFAMDGRFLRFKEALSEEERREICDFVLSEYRPDFHVYFGPD